MARLPFRRRKPLGFVVTQQGDIERKSLDLDGMLLWGKQESDHKRPCWLTPERIHRARNLSFLILQLNSHTPIAVPGETPVETSIEKLSNAMGEQYKLTQVMSFRSDATMIRMWVMMVMVLLTLGLVATALALSGGQLFSRFFGGS
jgi:hypothetical protein